MSSNIKWFIEGQLNACLSVLNALTIGQAHILTTKQHIIINLSKRLLGLTVSSLYDGFELNKTELGNIEQAIINMSD
jgi:hypothetical protein